MMTMHEDINIFIDCMTRLHCQHPKADIDQFVKSVAEDVVDKSALKQKMVDILEFVANKNQFTTEEIVSHFGFNQTTAKRYLRQLTEFGYLESHGGNKNRTYSKSTK